MACWLGSVDFPSFLEGLSLRLDKVRNALGFNTDFPSFLEGLSLRLVIGAHDGYVSEISLPFWKGFH